MTDLDPGTIRVLREEATATADLLALILDVLRERLPSNLSATSGPVSDEDADQAPTDPPAPERAADRMRADNLEAFKHEASRPMREHGDCCEAADLPGEPVEPGDLRAGDKVSFMLDGERITRTLVNIHDDAKWCRGITDLRLIERAPREDELDAAVWHRQFEKEKARAEKAEAERDEWEAAYRRVDGAYSRARNERDMWQAKFEQTDNLLSRTRDERDKWRRVAKEAGSRANSEATHRGAVEARYEALRADMEALHDSWHERFMLLPDATKRHADVLDDCTVALGELIDRHEDARAKGEQR